MYPKGGDDILDNMGMELERERRQSLATGKEAKPPKEELNIVQILNKREDLKETYEKEHYLKWQSRDNATFTITFKGEPKEVIWLMWQTKTSSIIMSDGTVVTLREMSQLVI